MRWKQQQKTDLTQTNKRIRRGFLFFPMTLDEETRWLERATWIEEYVEGDGRDFSAGDWWRPIAWVD